VIVLAVLTGCLAAVLLLVLGVRDLASVSVWRRDVALMVLDDAGRGRSQTLANLDRRFRRTPPGQWVERQLVLAGVERPPLVVAAATVVATVVLCWLLARTLAPLFGVVGLVVGAQGLRVFLARARNRRREQFVAQMPELARVLANATSAGLSLRTALEMAAEELSDPARTELRRISDQLAFGASLDSALQSVEERLPSREVAVLVSTLLVSARSGGSLVSALRDIADTLDTRKEVRREIRTVLAQALATGYMVIGMGVALLFMLNLVRPGTVEKMTVQPLGQAALVVAGALYTAGALGVRRMTRIEP
jgi:tight adherence protein B